MNDVIPKEPDEVRIVEFHGTHAKDFADLNYEWIAQAYTVEAHDREILDDPVNHIIKPGGQVFFALVGDKVAGTVALIPLDDDSFELAKMAVSPNYRGQGIGDLLMSACIEYSIAADKRRIILESNTKQVAAIKLYRKFGFQETPLDPNSLFARANIRMELDLTA